LVTLERTNTMDFGHKTKQQFQFGEKTERTHCPRCMRTKEEAITEQVTIGSVCDDTNCCFARAILEAIKEAQSNKFCINCGHEFISGDIFCINCGCHRLESY